MRFGQRVTLHPQHPLRRLGITEGILIPPPHNRYPDAVWIRVQFEGFALDCTVTSNNDEVDVWLDISEPVSAQQLVIPA